MPLRYCYPECGVLIEPHPRVQPLQCYRTSCPANQNCAEIMAHRVHYLFEEVLLDAVEMLFLYFKLRDNQGFWVQSEWVPSLGAGLFYRDMREPHWMRLNRWGFNKVKDEGTTMRWVPTDEFLFITGSNDILIPETSLVKLDD